MGERFVASEDEIPLPVDICRPRSWWTVTSFVDTEMMFILHPWDRLSIRGSMPVPADDEPHDEGRFLLNSIGGDASRASCE